MDASEDCGGGRESRGALGSDGVVALLAASYVAAGFASVDGSAYVTVACATS